MRKSCSLNIGTNGYCSKRHGVGSEQISPIQISPKQITKFHPHWHHLIPVNRIVKSWVNEKILPIEECSTLSLPNIRQQQGVVRAYVSPMKTSTTQISVIQIREPLTRKLNVSTYSDTCSVPGDTPWKLTASEKILYIEEGNKLLSAPRGNSGDRTNIYCTSLCHRYIFLVYGNTSHHLTKMHTGDAVLNNKQIKQIWMNSCKHESIQLLHKI